MKNYKILISRVAHVTKMLVLGGIVAMTCSCDDFLTISPTDKIILEDFWKTKDDVNSVVAESYRLMSTSDFLNRLIVWGELRSDNVIEGNYNGNNTIKYIMEANLRPNNDYAKWDVFYKIINNCNIVLKYAPGVLDEDPDFAQGDLDVVQGEMRAIRALCHFYLVRTFRWVPLMTEAIVDNSQNLKQAQAEPLVVLDACLADLEFAQKHVLTSGNYPTKAENKGRITKDAVRTMIADVLLWKAAFLEYEGKKAEAKECYSECIVYCDSVLNTRMRYMDEYLQENPNYFEGTLRLTLHEDYPILYPDKTKGGYELPSASNAGRNRTTNPIYDHIFVDGTSLCESILEIPHSYTSQAANYEVPTFYGYYDGSKFVTSLLSAPRYMAEVGLSGGATGSLYKKSDFRRINYIFSQAEGGKELDTYSIIKYGYLLWNEDRSKVDGDNAQYEFGKIAYTYIPSVTSGGRRYLDLAVNWILYRVSDVMLMKAEALSLRNEGDDLDNAFNLVSAVYNRSQSGYTSDAGLFGYIQPADLLKKEDYSSAEAMLDLVLKERQRELAFEGKRWYDLVRKALRDGKTDAVLEVLVPRKYESNGDAYRAKLTDINSFFFPIAEREINTNDLLNQNPVYEEDDKFGTN